MRADLAVISQRYVFHMMDDSAMPDALPVHAVRSVVELAAALNASVLGLNPSMLPFWTQDSAVTRLEVPWALAGEGVTVLRGSPHTRYVAQQGFALWETAALLRTLSDPPFGNGGLGNSHRDWERGWNEWRRRGSHAASAVARIVAASVAAADLGSRSYALELGSGAPAELRALHGVLDVGHGGLIKGGLCACAWVRTVTSSSLMRRDDRSAAAMTAAGERHSAQAMGLSPKTWSRSHAAVRNGTGWLGDPDYAFCRAPSPLLFADHERSGCRCDGTVCRRCSCAASR